MPTREHSVRRTIPVAGLVAVLALGACGSDDDGTDDEPATDETTTVVPADPNDVSGGVPVDNLNPDIEDDEFQEPEDVDD